MNLPPDIDLSRNRKVDQLFPFWVKRDGLQYAIDSWRRHEQYEQRNREYEEQRQKEEDRLNNMARMHLYDKTTYKEIARLFGYANPKIVSHLLKGREGQLIRAWHKNREKVENFVKIPPPKFQFYLDQEVILQEMCAMHMGGEEMLGVLNQLINLGSDNEKR